VERNEPAHGDGLPQIPVGQWVKPSSLKVKNIAQAWYGSAHFARAFVAQELYENSTLNSRELSENFKRYFAVHLLVLTYASTVKSYLFPGVETFEVKFQSYPSLPPPPPQKKKK
jgi:hypothetical protein